MEPETFDSEHNPNAPVAFDAWQQQHDGGFYINRRSSTRGMLHRVPCKHVGGAGEWDDEFGDVTRKPKVCHTNLLELVRWAGTAGVVLTVCSDCCPQGS
jgi:hypothetical protein